MLAPGTRCGSSSAGGGAAAGPRGASNSPLDRVGSGAGTVPTRRSGGTSGWKSSTAGDEDDAGGRGGSVSETALAEVLSDGPSVIPGPFRVSSPATCSGSPRQRGWRTGSPPGVVEFLCSGYVK